MNKTKKHIILLIVIHVIIILSLLLISTKYGTSVKSVNKDAKTLLLKDDGYYRIAGEFAKGGSLLHNRIGPGMPLIYSPIYLFPESFHPYVRLCLAILFNIGTIILLWFISKNFLSIKEYFVGSLFLLLNPIFIHWTFKSAPDIYMAFFVALFVYFLLKSYDNKKDYKNFPFASIILIFSIFIRPSVLLIPPILIIIGLFIRSKKLLIQSFLLLLLCFIGFSLNRKISNQTGQNMTTEPVDYTTGIGSFINNTYLLDQIVNTKKITKGIRHNNNDSSLLNWSYRSIEWQNNFIENNPNAGSIDVLFEFIKENPKLVIRKIYLNPIFIFTLAARQIEFYIYLIFTTVTLFFVCLGIYYIKKDEKFWILMGVIFGYLLLFIIVHAYSRYSVGILPLISMFAGYGFFKVNKMIKINKYV